MTDIRKQKFHVPCSMLGLFGLLVGFESVCGSLLPLALAALNVEAEDKTMHCEYADRFSPIAVPRQRSKEDNRTGVYSTSGTRPFLQRTQRMVVRNSKQASVAAVALWKKSYHELHPQIILPRIRLVVQNSHQALRQNSCHDSLRALVCCLL
jgi:hypothetical protein